VRLAWSGLLVVAEALLRRLDIDQQDPVGVDAVVEPTAYR
jgi:hypothetical protein